MVEWMLTLKLSRAEALAVLRAEPGVLEQSEEQLQLKAAFFCDVIGNPNPNTNTNTNPNPNPNPNLILALTLALTTSPSSQPYPYS